MRFVFKIWFDAKLISLLRWGSEKRAADIEAASKLVVSVTKRGGSFGWKGVGVKAKEMRFLDPRVFAIASETILKGSRLES
ncbi:MAG: hypothetical protein ACKESB_00560 [Candidatus Hodgkinia cicadicola]